MNLYYLRCIEADVPVLISLGKVLGALEDYTDEHGVVRVRAALDGNLDMVGPIYGEATDTGTVDSQGMPVFQRGAVKVDGSGNPYWHANLLTPLDLRATAESMAVSNPEIAANLAHIGRFFVTDANGVAIPPTQPAHVFL